MLLAITESMINYYKILILIIQDGKEMIGKSIKLNIAKNINNIIGKRV